MRGVSLLEVLVVVAIIAILSLIGVNTINNFKKDADLDNATSELISEIRTARGKSMNGELVGVEKEEDFESNGLPEYGLVIEADGYKLVRQCNKADGTNCSSESPLESVLIGSEFSLSPEGSFYFERITGNFPGRNLTIIDKNKKYGRQISISQDFLITVTKI